MRSITFAFVYLRHDPFTLTLVDVALVVVVAHLVGRLFGLMRQPPVIGEVIAGIALGPTLLGGASETLFPLDSRPLLKMLATLGLVTFMFLVGLELETVHLEGRQRLAASVSVFGQALPFALGLALATVLYSSHETGRFAPFALFIGSAMSITALPVLVRILREQGLHDKPLGVVVTASAAVGDLLAWTTLAAVVATVSSSGGWDLPYIVATFSLFALIMFRVVGPWLRRFTDSEVTEGVLSLAMAGILTCSFITSAIGVHEVFGAFLLGIVFPRGALSQALHARLSTVAYFLLPVFFVTSGLNVNLRSIDAQGLWQLGLILLVAFGGKVVGASVAARLHGLPRREAMAIGVLMNTRGLTELVVLNIGLQLKVLDQELFSALVVMAVVTTVATGPLLALLKPDPYLRAAPSPRRGVVAPDPATGETTA